MYNAGLVFSKEQFRELQEELQRLKGAFIRAGDAAMESLAMEFQKQVIQGYMKGGAGPPLAKSTLDTRQQGKRAGRRPRKPKFAGTTALRQTGKLMKLLEIKSSKGVRAAKHHVRIRGGLRMSGGGESMQVAMVHEFGATFSVAADVAMRAYLLALARGVAGSSVNVAVPPGTRNITIRIPARPVWVPAWLPMIKKSGFTGPKGFTPRFQKALKRQTGKALRF